MRSRFSEMYVKTLYRAGRRLEALDVLVQIGQRRLGNGADADANLIEQAVLDLLDEIGDVLVMRVERTAREARVLGERGHAHAGNVVSSC